MRRKKYYRVVVTTDWYHANRDGNRDWQYDDEGCTEVWRRPPMRVLESGMELREAQKYLTELWNEKNDWEAPHMDNWGLIVRWYGNSVFGANSFPDGTRSFGYDVYRYEIREDKNEQ